MSQHQVQANRFPHSVTVKPKTPVPLHDPGLNWEVLVASAGIVQRHRRDEECPDDDD
ncbi:MAG: hypothetical protein ACR2RL_05995 [Gammaproteobacteria bacterium]